MGFTVFYKKFRWLYFISVCLIFYSDASFSATQVNVVALFKDKAMITINGSKPYLIAKGETHLGVSLIGADSDQAILEVDGKRLTLALGQGLMAGPPSSGAQKVVLSADARGHFFVSGTINGAPADFLVDTGASTIAISTALAKRMGISYLSGERGYSATAAGTASVYRVVFNTVKVGAITLNQVEGVVVEGNQLPVALLGMSFLNRLSMKREGNTMTLIKQY